MEEVRTSDLNVRTSEPGGGATGCFYQMLPPFPHCTALTGITTSFVGCASSFVGCASSFVGCVSPFVGCASTFVGCASSFVRCASFPGPITSLLLWVGSLPTQQRVNARLV
jgi:hypothetical protein